MSHLIPQTFRELREQYQREYGDRSPRELTEVGQAIRDAHIHVVADMDRILGLQAPPCPDWAPHPPPGWTLDASGPFDHEVRRRISILTSTDGYQRVVLCEDGSLSATYRGVASDVPHDAAVFLLAIYAARKDSQ